MSEAGSSAIEVSVDIGQTWVGDLTVDLFAPDGRAVALHSRNGGSKDMTGIQLLQTLVLSMRLNVIFV